MRETFSEKNQPALLPNTKPKLSPPRDAMSLQENNSQDPRLDDEEEEDESALVSNRFSDFDGKTRKQTLSPQDKAKSSIGLEDSNESLARQDKINRRTRTSGHFDQEHFEAIFLLYDAKTLSFKVSQTITKHEGGERISPPQESEVPYPTYSFETEQEIRKPPPDRWTLFFRIRDEFDRYVDVEQPWIDLFATLCLLSYEQEKLMTVPYLYLYGDNECGKTTVLNVFSELCYRPMFGVANPAAEIYGYLGSEEEEGIPTILEDEISGIEQDNDKLKIFRVGYKRGAKVTRTSFENEKRKLTHYRAFCFKAIASEKIPSVKGFSDRFIFKQMSVGHPRREWADLTDEDRKRFSSLHNDLLKWRLANKEKPLQNLENLPVSGRMRELWKPILQVVEGLPVYHRLLNFMEQQRSERIRRKQNSLEGQLLKVVLKKIEEAEAQKVKVLAKSADPSITLYFSEIWSELESELDAESDQLKSHQMETSEFGRISKKLVASRIVEVLDGKKQKIGPNRDSAYTFNLKKLRNIAKSYDFGVRDDWDDSNDAERNSSKRRSSVLDLLRLEEWMRVAVHMSGPRLKDNPSMLVPLPPTSQSSLSSQAVQNDAMKGMCKSVKKEKQDVEEREEEGEKKEVT